jgi:hypothetical protein
MGDLFPPLAGHSPSATARQLYAFTSGAIGRKALLTHIGIPCDYLPARPRTWRSALPSTILTNAFAAVSPKR